MQESFDLLRILFQVIPSVVTLFHVLHYQFLCTMIFAVDYFENSHGWELEWQGMGMVVMGIMGMGMK